MDYEKSIKISYNWLEKSLEECSKLNSVELDQYVWSLLYLSMF